MLVVDILPESFNVFQITLTQAVKVWKTEYVMLHSNIQGGPAIYSWAPFLGHVMVDIMGFINRGTVRKGDEVRASYMDASGVIHTHTCRTIVYNNDAFIYVGNGM